MQTDSNEKKFHLPPAAESTKRADPHGFATSGLNISILPLQIDTLIQEAKMPPLSHPSNSIFKDHQWHLDDLLQWSLEKALRDFVQTFQNSLTAQNHSDNTKKLKSKKKKNDKHAEKADQPDYPVKVKQNSKHIRKAFRSYSPHSSPLAAFISDKATSIIGGNKYEKDQEELSINYSPPESWFLLGSYVLNIALHPRTTLHPSIDIGALIPKSVFYEKDYLNFRYHDKRLLYITHLASCIEKMFHESIHQISIGNSAFANDPSKPLLQFSFRPQYLDSLVHDIVSNFQQKKQKSHKIEKDFNSIVHTLSSYVIYIVPFIHEDTFSIQKLASTRTNIQYHIQSDVQPHSLHSIQSEALSSFQLAYNQSILQESTLLRHLKIFHQYALETLHFYDALILLKLWASRRGLKSLLSGYLLTVLLCLTIKKKLVSSRASTNHLFRATLQFIVRGALRDSQNSSSFALSHCSIDDQDHLLELQQNNSLKWNAAFMIDFASRRRIESEAAAVFRILDAPGLQRDPFYGAHFHLFFPRHSLPLTLQFDAYFHVSATFSNMVHALTFHHLALNIVSFALGNRCSLVTIVSTNLDALNTSKDSDDEAEGGDVVSCKIIFGVLFNWKDAFMRVDRAPLSSKDSASYKEFWGDKVELRRFKSGDVSEVIVWGSDEGDRRDIPLEIIEYILPNKIPWASNWGFYSLHTQLDLALPPWKSAISNQLSTSSSDPIVILTDYTATTTAFDNLSSILRDAESLPLKLISISSTSPILRFTAVTPQISPGSRCMDPISMIVAFESSSVWPNNLIAVRSAKIAFYLTLSDHLKSHGIKSLPTAEYLDVQYSGLVFRLIIRYEKELSLIRSSPDEGPMCADKMQFELYDRLKLHEFVRSVAFDGGNGASSFPGAVRLAKRWIAAQLFSGHFCEELIEVLVAYTFVNSNGRPMGKTPTTALSGFTAFLYLLSNFPWFNSPLIIYPPFQEGDDRINYIERINTLYRQAFKAFGKSGKYPIVVATEDDIEGHLFSTDYHRGPDKVVLQRLIAVASSALKYIENELVFDAPYGHDVKSIFRPSKDIYDLKFKLNKELIHNLWADVDTELSHAAKKIKRGSLGAVLDSSISTKLYEFHPVQIYYELLRAQFGHMALFFYDEYGGDFIGGVWRPWMKAAKSFSLENARYSEPKLSEDNQNWVDMNLTEILNDMKLLGKGLVIDLVAKK